MLKRVKFKFLSYSPRKEELEYRSRKILRCGRKVVTTPMIPEISAPAAASFQGDSWFYQSYFLGDTLTIAAS